MATTEKEKKWLAEYYVCWNATEAARRAGYKSPLKQGWQKKEKFADEIKTHIEELQMGADEVLIRLAEHARGSLADFADVTLLTDLKNHPKAHLVKKLRTDVSEGADGKINYRTHFELYDAQAALVHIGKHLGLFNDKVEHEHTGQVDVKVIGGVSLDDV